jgi:hypothetical protein
MFVFINGYGSVKFRPLEISTTGSDTQFRGKIKLPKGIKSGEGKKWINHDYWFAVNQIHKTH